MKRVCLYLFTLFIFNMLSAQKVHYIYLQSENQQPFFVRINEKNHNSSASGYLIISKLTNGTYPVAIGLPGQSVPDLVYEFKVDNKDQGYLLKNFGEQGWGLFSWQSMNVLMPETKKAEVTLVKTEPKDVSSFTDLLAKASNDSTLKERPVIEKAEEKKEPIVPPVAEAKEEKQVVTTAMVNKEDAANINRDTVAVNTLKPQGAEAPVVEVKEKIVNDDTLSQLTTKPVNPVGIVQEKPVNTDSVSAKETVIPENKAKEEVKVPVIQNTPVVEKSDRYQKSAVKLNNESSTTDGIRLEFTDTKPDGNADIIRILIPVKPQQIITETPKRETEVKNPVDTITKKPEVPLVAKKNECIEVATEDDFFRLRRRMAGETNDESMIEEAKKTFRSKCFSTLQIRNLGSLFLNDAGKYRFFDEAYRFVSDPDKYHELASELKDPYYINRFNAMIR